MARTSSLARFSSSAATITTLVVPSPTCTVGGAACEAGVTEPAECDWALLVPASQPPAGSIFSAVSLTSSLQGAERDLLQLAGRAASCLPSHPSWPPGCLPLDPAAPPARPKSAVAAKQAGQHAQVGCARTAATGLTQSRHSCQKRWMAETPQQPTGLIQQPRMLGRASAGPPCRQPPPTLAAGCSTSSSLRMVAPSLVIVTSPMSSTSICGEAAGRRARSQGWNDDRCGCCTACGQPLAHLVQAHRPQAGLQDVCHRLHRRGVLRAHILAAGALALQLQLRAGRPSQFGCEGRAAGHGEAVKARGDRAAASARSSCSAGNVWV